MVRNGVTIVTVEGVNDKEFGRERALHKFVASKPMFQNEFHALENGKYGKLYYKLDRNSVNEYWRGMQAYVKSKKFKVVDEHATLLERDTCYDVYVRYTIEWEF